MAEEEVKEKTGFFGKLKPKTEEKINPFMKNMLKGLIPMIKGKLPEINTFMKGYLSEIELREWETKAGIVCLVGSDDVAYILTVAFDKDDTVKRVIKKVSAVDFIETILKSF